MVKYSVEKSKYDPCYVLWKETTSKQGICYRGIFKGTRSECIEQRKLLKKENK